MKPRSNEIPKPVGYVKGQSVKFKGSGTGVEKVFREGGGLGLVSRPLKCLRRSGIWRFEGVSIHWLLKKSLQDEFPKSPLQVQPLGIEPSCLTNSQAQPHTPKHRCGDPRLDRDRRDTAVGAITSLGVSDALQALRDPTAVQQLEVLQPQTQDAQKFLHWIAEKHPGLDSATKLTDFIANKATPGSPLAQAGSTFKARIDAANQQAHQSGGTAGHRDKRSLARDLGFHESGRTIAELLKLQPQTGVGSPEIPQIVWRARIPPDQVPPRFRVLADTKCRPEDDLICDPEHGFYDVEPNQTVIFLSNTEENPVVELVVIRGVASGFDLSDELYAWLVSVVSTACSERRDIRPTHPGKLVQVGWNAGPRHCRIFGLAKSYTKNLDPAVARDHDEDVIAAVALTWGLCRALLPAEVISEIDGYLKDSGLPAMATRNVEPGNFSVPLKPDGIVANEIMGSPSHRDLSYTGWTMSLTAEHTVDTVAPAVGPTTSSGGPSQTRTGFRSSHAQGLPLAAEDVSSWPMDGGGNFVDLTLMVKVKQARRTLTAFRPQNLHGSTRLCGAHSIGCTIPFCTRLLDAYNIAQKGTSVVSGEGTGSDGVAGDSEAGDV
ncbi:hypothetical protein C8F04DRAFT_1190374 [Mycena alexandri]|uniref:Uncharacterized protein n=1 Tax=Mycena alexandri TaxID=1745969 RepID=A0AAD6SJC4_9AGAR|nr:hypothetical protein C8F04DRAFT_1190374 [Mycena alexandri]